MPTLCPGPHPPLWWGPVVTLCRGGRCWWLWRQVASHANQVIPVTIQERPLGAGWPATRVGQDFGWEPAVLTTEGARGSRACVTGFFGLDIHVYTKGGVHSAASWLSQAVVPGGVNHPSDQQNIDHNYCSFKSLPVHVQSCRLIASPSQLLNHHRVSSAAAPAALLFASPEGCYPTKQP